MLFRRPPDEGSSRLRKYSAEVADGFCPFIRPALARNVLYFSEYRPRLRSGRSNDEYVFSYGVIHTELLRVLRRRAAAADKVLACENLIFRAEGEQNFGSALLEQAHWCLKLLYTDCGILFGKFWIGEIAHARDGRPMPIPPYHLLSIRSGVKTLDTRFFTKAQELRPAFVAAEDRGQDAFEHVALTGVQNRIVARVRGLEPQSVTRRKVNDLAYEIVQSNLYASVQNWRVDEERRIRHLKGANGT